MDPYDALRAAFADAIERNDLAGKSIGVRCGALSPAEAIGEPEHDDYPILKGKEVMVEAVFEGARGQAFSDSFENAEYLVDDLPAMALDSNRSRASFVAGLNAVYRHLGLCEGTVHCRDGEPADCAGHLLEAAGSPEKVLLVGYQPRFLHTLAAATSLRVVDMDADNIGAEVAGVCVEPPESTADAMAWCDLIFATGSTLVNGSITTFLEQEKPVLFYGVTVAAAAEVLGLDRFCHGGH
jgi:hypothetical protein